MKPHEELTRAAELDLLGAVCSGASPAHLAAESSLEASDFAEPKHGALWAALVAVEAAGQDTTNPHVVASRLVGTYRASDLLELAIRSRSLSKALEVAGVVKGWSRCRSALAGFQAAYTSIQNATPDTLASRLETVRALGAETGIGRTDMVDLSVAIREFGRDLISKETVEVIPTSIQALTSHIGGFQPGTYVLSAVTKGGKSSLSSQMAWAAAMSGCPALYFTLEMPRRQVVARLNCQVNKVSSSRLMQRKLTADEMIATDAFIRRWDKPSGAFTIDDSPGHTVESIAARTHSWLAREEVKAYRKTRTPGLVVVDYLQLVSGSAGRDANKEQQTAHASVGLHNLALKLGIPIIVLAQLNAQGEHRHSSQIAMDADMDLQIVYPGETGDDPLKPERFPTLVIRRARSCAPGKIEMKFEGEFFSFAEWRHGL